MVKAPKITVITPTYNRADYIAETIESILSQDFEDFEYFILDDGSTDNTKKIVKPYLKDKRVKYFYRDNSGESATVNWGWSIANGEYFTQVNSDDPILPGLFSEMVKVLDKNKKAVVAYPNFYITNEQGQIKSENKGHRWDFERYLTEFCCLAACAGTFIRKEPFKDWEKIRDTRFKYINDIYMYWDMALEGNFIYVPKFLATWRDHSGGISFDRYKSIPEVEIWFEEYFSKKDLPKEILKLKDRTKQNIYKYFIMLINDSNLTLEEKSELSRPYHEKLGLPVYDFANLQIGDNDLIGNKFNGHDLHLYLRERNIDSTHLVNQKSSDDETTYHICTNKHTADIKKYIGEWEKYYNTQAMFYPFTMDIIRFKLFQDANIVHYHLINNFFFNLQMLPLMTRMKPSVWTIHDPWILGGHCIYPFECNKWKTHCGDCSYFDTNYTITRDTTSLNFELKREIMQNSKLSLIVASKWMENLVKTSPITKHLPVYRVPFGINQKLFKPKDSSVAKKALNINPDSFVIMFRADRSAFKGLDIIKESLKNIEAKDKITLLTVGEKGLLKELKTKYKSKFDIKEYGWLKDDKKLVKLYQACDLFLMPSRQEAFGMMAIEAMSCGKTVLSTKGTALTDTINAPKCGIATKHDVNDYTKELQRLMDNPEVLKKHNLKSLEYAKKNHSHEVYLDKMISVYKEVMKNHKIDDNAKFVLDQYKKYNRIETRDIKVIKKDDFRTIFDCLGTYNRLDIIKKKYKNKKIIFYGSGLLFEELLKYYDLSEFNIVAVADKKFKKETKTHGFRAIPPEAIIKEKPDLIVISVLYANVVEDYLVEKLYLNKTVPEIEAIAPIEKIWWY